MNGEYSFTDIHEDEESTISEACWILIGWTQHDYLKHDTCEDS